jgi:hypothetical protein
LGPGIAFNGHDGVLVDTGTGNPILGNRIFMNAVQGIELVNGGNHNQGAPTLTSAMSAGGMITVSGTLTSMPGTNYMVELFATDPVLGQVFLGTVMVTTDGTGMGTFSMTFNVNVAVGQLVTATATSPTNDTSAFAAPVPVT